jgi:pyruvate dehydrogenase E1 component alpha subunit
MDHDDLLGAYRRLRLLREFEERTRLEFQTGQIAGFTHLYAGMEAIAVGVCEHLSDEDKIISTHRGHGHCLKRAGGIQSPDFFHLLMDMHLQRPVL